MSNAQKTIPETTGEVLLTLGDAIAYWNAEGASRRMLLHFARTPFLERMKAGRWANQSDQAELGKDWVEAYSSLFEAFSLPLQERLVACRAVFRDALRGLRKLKGGVDTLTTDLLMEEPELAYIGLVYLFVDHPAKMLIVGQHERVEADMQTRRSGSRSKSARHAA